MNRRSTIVAAVIGAVVGGAGISSAAWTGTSTTAGLGGGKALKVPQVAGVNAADGTGSSVITWTAVTAAQFAPGVSGYKVVRYTNQTGATGATTICAKALTATCTDSSNTAGTFWYGVTALYTPAGGSWSGVESARDSATVTAADTATPTVAANCPTSGHAAYATGNNGASSWHSLCGDAASVSATDNVGVVSVAMKITKGTTCFTGSSFTAAQCSAAGPSGYPAGYIAATHGTGSVWSVGMTNSQLGTGSLTLDAQAKDAAGNTGSLTTVSFTAS